MFNKNLDLSSGNHLIQNKTDLPNGYYILSVSDEDNILKTSKIDILSGLKKCCHFLKENISPGPSRNLI